MEKNILKSLRKSDEENKKFYGQIRKKWAVKPLYDEKCKLKCFEKNYRRWMKQLISWISKFRWY